MAKENLENWLMLSHIFSQNAVIAHKILPQFNYNIAELFRNSKAILAKLGLRDYFADMIATPDWSKIEPDLQWLQQREHSVVTLLDDNYPKLLHETPIPPLLLYIDGNAEILSSLQLAIVGSRNPTHTGRANAFDFAKHLATAGLTITSGLALGIDAASHRGALSAKGTTIAVMGTGLDTTYPYQNQSLARTIVEQGGALVSEFPLKTPPTPANFPYRNRIVSGLSIGALIVEATIRSGSLITARCATEQGREVFAIPGSIHNPLARGCHQLLRQGAKLVETAADILEELGPLARAGYSAASNKRLNTCDTQRSKNKNALDPDYQKLLEYIGYETTPIDIIVERSNMAVNEISSMLLILELQGVIAHGPGGYTRL